MYKLVSVLSGVTYFFFLDLTHSVLQIKEVYAIHPHCLAITTTCIVQIKSSLVQRASKSSISPLLFRSSTLSNISEELVFDLLCCHQGAGEMLWFYCADPSFCALWKLQMCPLEQHCLTVNYIPAQSVNHQ